MALTSHLLSGLPDGLRGADTFGNHFEGIETEALRRIGHPEDASWG